MCSVTSDATPWTTARQAPLSIEFPRQEYWSGLPFPTPGDLPDPGIKPTSLASPALTDGFFITVPVSTYCIYISIRIYHNNCLNFMNRGYRGKGSPLVKLRDPPKKKKSGMTLLLHHCLVLLSPHIRNFNDLTLQGVVH